MTLNPRTLAGRLFEWPTLNFLLTNRIPRRQLTLFTGWFARLEQPLVRWASIGLWRFFADVDFSDTARSGFRSLHAAFTRELLPGARPLDADPAALLSPCDAQLGAHGTVQGGMALQAKGHDYPLAELLTDAALAQEFAGCEYATLRLTAGMYHRFHAPADCEVEQVDFVAGDVWNVNPQALARVPRLYCRNERAVLRCRLDSGEPFLVVPVAAILVASLKLHCLQERLHLRYRGPTRLRCQARYARGQELGWFEQGSTIIVFAPRGHAMVAGLAAGRKIRMGEALFRRGEDR
jgi:phosphatidylserine decarboxylase